MPKIKTSELCGAALNDAVTRVVFGLGCRELDVQGTPWNFCGDWALGGPLLDRFDVALNGGVIGSQKVIYATVRNVPKDSPYGCSSGPDRLTAACRAIVSAHLGDEVDIPEELV